MGDYRWTADYFTAGERPRPDKYEAQYCPECGEKRCPPEMDMCPICHPEADHHE